MEFTGERVVLENVPRRVANDHIERYRFAGRAAVGADVVDVASGSGYGAEVLLDCGVRSYRGFDVDASAVESAVRTYSHARASFAVAEARSLPLEDHSVGVLTSFETIEHTYDGAAVLSEFRRVLARRGTLFLSTPNRRIVSPGKSVHEKPNNRFHRIEYTASEVRALLLASGFEVMSEWWQRTTWSGLSSRVAAGAAKRLRLPERVRFGWSSELTPPSILPAVEPRYIVFIASPR